jgi:DNA-binding Xre family transcriptional regulator
MSFRKNKLEELRLKAGFNTKKAFADAANISEAQYSRLSKAKDCEGLTLDRLESLARILKVHPAEIIYDIDVKASGAIDVVGVANTNIFYKRSFQNSDPSQPFLWTREPEGGFHYEKKQVSFLTDRKELVAYRVKHNFMDAYAKEGGHIIVSKDYKTKWSLNGKLIVIEIENEPFFQFCEITQQEKVFLKAKSTNGAQYSCPLEKEDFNIIGEVIGCVKEF